MVSAKWTIVSGFRQFHELAGRDISIGWARDIEKEGQARTVTVCVAESMVDLNGLPDECRTALQTKGRSATEAVLDEDVPPRYIAVTSAGLSPEYD